MLTLSRALGIGFVGVALTSLGAGTAKAPFAGPKAMKKVEGDRSPRTPTPSRAAPAETTCPPLTLPDRSVCVHLPEDEAARGAEGGGIARDSRWDLEDVIPRRPDRPVDYGAYRYPVPCEGCVVTDGELERTNVLQHRTPAPQFAEPGEIELAVARGTPVTVPMLEHQQGPPELIYAGPLLDSSVVTRHSVHEADDEREYIVALGPLDFAPGMAASGAGPAIPLHDGQLLGSVGSRGSSAPVRLRVLVRRVRKGVDVRAVQPAMLFDVANTVACDPRNLLPLK